MNEDARIDRTIMLLQESWSLLRRLQDLRRELPQPTDDARRLAAPRDKRLDSYAVLTHRLEASLRFALVAAVKDLEVRGHWDIRREILPPSAKGLTNEEWLNWLDQQLGSEPPTS
jgi:hypothetical protein